MSASHLRCFCLLVLAISSIGAHAQNPNTTRPKEFVVGISLDSNYARIADFLPMLRKSLVKDIPRRQKQVRVVAVDALPRDAASAAKTKGCDYLLQLSVLEITGAGVGVGFNTLPPSRDISPEEERSRRELQWVRIDYRLQSLEGEGLNEEGIDHVLYAEYPSGWNSSAFETTVIRAVTRVAVATLDNLPRK
ncbi:MAG: hypothetical protein WA628_08530 [Terriglobales bacterium]